MIDHSEVPFDQSCVRVQSNQARIGIRTGFRKTDRRVGADPLRVNKDVIHRRQTQIVAQALHRVAHINVELVLHRVQPLAAHDILPPVHRSNHHHDHQRHRDNRLDEAESAAALDAVFHSRYSVYKVLSVSSIGPKDPDCRSFTATVTLICVTPPV